MDVNLRNALSERLGSRDSRNVRRIVDNFDLSYRSVNVAIMVSQSKRIYLHGATIDEESVELLGSLGSGVCPGELDRGDATASTILVVGEHDSSDGASRLVEVFLYRKQRRSVFSSDNLNESAVLECRKYGGANDDSQRREHQRAHSINRSSVPS